MDKNDSDFKELEKINAQIDLWIDEENYDKIFGNAGIELQKDASVKVQKCFPKGDICTFQKDPDWQAALPRDAWPSPPVDKVPSTSLNNGKKLSVPEEWSHLFYGKYLRSKIQERSYSDCYTRRYDDLVAYLERHLPNHRNAADTDEEGRNIRLAIVYLLELAAASFGSESMGYAERARRLIKEAKLLKLQQEPFEFYELCARYNIGVAHFHIREYRNAVLEFNKIIWQVRTWEQSKREQDKKNRTFFNDLCGKQLLLIPAKLYRAEVQLKLQLAYHALKILEDPDFAPKDGEVTEDARLRDYLNIRINIISAQAYQQLGRLDRSWESLKNIYAIVFPNKINNKKLTLESVRYRSDFLKGAKFHLTDGDIEQCHFPILAERFLDILTEEYLNWMKVEGEDEEDRHPLLTELLLQSKAIRPKGIKADDFAKAVDEAKLLFTIHYKLFKPYYSVIKNNAENRQGYFQQLAKYLSWLSDAADLESEIKEGNAQKSTEKIRRTARGLYRLYRSSLLEIEPGLKPPKKDAERQLSNKCPFCSKAGIDLRRIEGEHYEWFTQAMFDFFDAFKYTKDRGRFVERLLLLERKEKDDLRIHDLTYRYKYWKPNELLEELRRKNPAMNPQRLCWPEFEETKPFPLLGCTGAVLDMSRDTDGNLRPHYIYQNIMDGWDEKFLRHIDKSSYHEQHSEGFYFLGLQRWNSSSPAKGFSVGGGYLLYHLNKKGAVDLGIAIDPGFDFVRNLFHSGYSLDDIDIVMISHAHLDHIRDFESIVTLLFELEKRNNRTKRVHVILSLGAYRRLEHIVEDPHLRYFVEPYIIDIDREIIDDYFEHLGEDGSVKFSFQSSQKGEKEGENAHAYFSERIQVILDNKDKKKESNLVVTIKPTRAYHPDQTYSDSFGFLIKLEEQEEKRNPLIFGYTGDTKWVYPDIPDLIEERKKKKRLTKDVAEQYSLCDALLVHLGSLIRPKEGKYLFSCYDKCTEKCYECEKLVRDEKHPYLVGLLRLLKTLSKEMPGKCTPLILVGEFGEELRGNIRSDLVSHLQKVYEDKLAFLPVDVGMNVKLGCKGESNTKPTELEPCACKVECVQCQQLINIDEADYRLYGTDHALYCVCKTCSVAVPSNILSATLARLYDTGIEIKTIP